MQPLILAAALMGVTAGFSSVAQQPVGQNLDPASVINPNLVNSEQWKQAVAIMDKTENGPSCPKRALAGLIDSCQSIDTQENYHAHGELSDIKKVHAARLAVCELDGAKVDNADLRACDDLVVQPDDVVSRHNWWQVGRRGLQKPELGPQIDKVQLKKCLEALHSNPQSWISYSNSLSVTHLMCQVSRVEIEKDQLLKTYLSHTFAIGNQSELLRQQHDFVAKALNLQEEVRKEIFKMQTEHLPNMQAKMVDLTGGLVQHRQDLQSTVDTAMNGFKENAKSAEMRMRYLEESVVSVSAGIESILDAAQSRNSEMAMMHAEELRIFKTEIAGTAVLISSLGDEITALGQLVGYFMKAVQAGSREWSQNMDRWREGGEQHSAQLDAHKSKLEASTKLVAELNDGLNLLRQFLPSIAAAGGLLSVLFVGNLLGLKAGASFLLLLLGYSMWNSIIRRVIVQKNEMLEYFSRSRQPFNMIVDGLPYAIIAITMIGFIWLTCRIIRAYRRSRRSIMDDEADDNDDEDVEKTHAAYY